MPAEVASINERPSSYSAIPKRHGNLSLNANDGARLSGCGIGDSG